MPYRNRHEIAVGQSCAQPSVTPVSQRERQSHVPASPTKDRLWGNMMQTVIQQLAQVLTILSGSAQLMLEGKASGSSAQMLRLWLQPTARMATAAMHRLRHLPLGQLAATNDLSQSLTVLVLASDLISQGYLAKDNGQESYELMLRNAARAMKSLGELRDELATNELYAEDV